MSCAAMRSQVWVNGTRVPDHYCGEANLMLLPVCTLNFVLGNTSTLFWKIYLDESLWICDVSWVSLTESLHLPVLVAMLLLAIFLCSHVRGTGTEWKWYIVANCWLFDHQELCTVWWFRHFAKRTMLLHSLPVKYLYMYLVRKHQPPQHTGHRFFQQATVALSHKKVSSHGTCKLQRHTLCGSLFLFKTERVLRAIQHTCFCQLWVISTNY